MSAAEAVQPQGRAGEPIHSTLAGDTWLLLSLRWTILWNSFRGRKLSTQIFSVLGGAVVFLVVVAISIGIGSLAGLLVASSPGLQLEAAAPGAILMAAVLLLLFSSFGTALGSLFLTSDIDLLMTAPVNRKAIFISKILDGLAWNYLLIIGLVVPALITYGFGLGYGPLYYLLAIVTILGAPLLPASLGAILVLFVARFAPARRVREVLGLVGALFGITCGLLGQTARFWTRAVEGNGQNDLQALLKQVQGVIAWPLPPFTAGRGLVAAGRGDILAALGDLAAFLLVTFGFFAACVYVADYMYATGWMRMQSSGSSVRSKQRAERAAQHGGWLSRVPADLAIALKDWRVIPRDLRNFAQMLAPLIIWPVIYLNITAGGERGGRSAANFMNNWGGVLAAATVLGSTVMLMGNIAFSSISREGKSWWLLKVAPISTFELIRGKFLVAAVPFAIVSTVAMIVAAVWRHLDPLWSLYGWLGVELLGLGMLAAAVALSVPWAKLDWDDPRRMNTGWGSIITMGLWVGLALVAGGALCLPVLAEALDAPLTPIFALLGLLLAAAIVGIADYTVYKFVERKLPEGN